MEVSWSSYRQRLLALAPEVPVRNNITVAFYYRSFYTYREQARQSLENFQYEQAFIYLLRCANLATQTIPSHKDYNEEKFSRDRKKIKLILPNIVDSLEKVSSILQQRYDNYDAYLEENKTAESDSQTNSVDVIESRDTFETIEGVQNIRYPSDLLDKFISISHRNTLEDVETCGILAGVLSGSEYRITTVINNLYCY